MDRPGEGMNVERLLGELPSGGDHKVRIVTPTGAEYRASFTQLEHYPDGTYEVAIYTTDRIPDPEGRLD